MKWQSQVRPGHLSRLCSLPHSLTVNSHENLESEKKKKSDDYPRLRILHLKFYAAWNMKRLPRLKALCDLNLCNLCNIIYHHRSSINSLPATSVRLLFLRCAKHTFTSGRLHLLFPLPVMFYLQMFTGPAFQLHSGLWLNIIYWQGFREYPVENSTPNSQSPNPVLLYFS